MSTSNYSDLSSFNINNLQDSYTLLYAYLVRALIDDYGIEGERAAREGTRRFGIDRGTKRRQQHIDAGYKVNMKSLFSIGGDLPGDPRFKRDLQRLNPEERVSHTLVCPMSDLWKKIGEKEIGRMYCEEFHFACYNSYAYGFTQVNLARTLTQDDDYCSFNVVLRPEFLPEELRGKCFEDYDPLYEEPKSKMEVANAKDGFNSLCIRIFYHILSASIELIGESANLSLSKALKRYAASAADNLKKISTENKLEITREFIEYNFPLQTDIEIEKMWSEYSGNDAKNIMKNSFYTIFLKEMRI